MKQNTINGRASLRNTNDRRQSTLAFSDEFLFLNFAPTLCALFTLIAPVFWGRKSTHTTCTPIRGLGALFTLPLNATQ